MAAKDLIGRAAPGLGRASCGDGLRVTIRRSVGPDSSEMRHRLRRGCAIPVGEATAHAPLHLQSAERFESASAVSPPPGLVGALYEQVPYYRSLTHGTRYLSAYRALMRWVNCASRSMATGTVRKRTDAMSAASVRCYLVGPLRRGVFGRNGRRSVPMTKEVLIDRLRSWATTPLGVRRQRTTGHPVTGRSGHVIRSVLRNAAGLDRALEVSRERLKAAQCRIDALETQACFSGIRWPCCSEQCHRRAGSRITTS